MFKFSPNLVYAKTQLGEDAVRQSNRLVQRNLRMVLLQVDGKLNVAELSDKIGNPRLVEASLKELEAGGFVVGIMESAIPQDAPGERRPILNSFEHSVDPTSQFSAFVPHTVAPDTVFDSRPSDFSNFAETLIPADDEPDFKSSPDVPVMPVSGPVANQREPREPMRWGWLKWLVPGSLVVTVAGAFLYPYNNFKPAFERQASQWFGVPVQIGSVGIAVWPRPALKLAAVRVADIRVAEVGLASPWNLLSDGVKSVREVSASGVEFKPADLLALPMMGDAGSGQRLGLQRVRLSNLTVALGDQLNVGGLNGELVLGDSGQLDKLLLETPDRSAKIEGKPGGGGLMLAFDVSSWTPEGAPMALTSLQAKGLLLRDKVQIQNIDGAFLGGLIRGNWQLDWSRGLTMTGDGSVVRLDPRKISATLIPTLKLEGELGGAFRLRASAGDWSKLWKALELSLDGEVTQGSLQGVDPFEAGRRGEGAEVRGGATRFQRLQYSLSVRSQQTVGRNIRIDAGAANGSGYFTYANGQVDGHFETFFRTSATAVQAPVKIYGNLPDLIAKNQAMQ